MKENELMLTSLLDCERIDLAVKARELTPEQERQFRQMKARRAQGEPVQYIIGKTDFMGIALAVDRRALIPRPETEILVELAVSNGKALRQDGKLNVLDLGTGSGNIAIAMAENISHAQITAVDVSAEALTLAKMNAKTRGVHGRIRFIGEDMSVYLKATSAEARKFNIIISNPPYIPTEELARLPADVRNEPRTALDGGHDGLHFYREILKYAYTVLSPDGLLALEIGDGQRNSIEKIFAQYPQYQRVEFFKDYVQTDRIVMARLSETF